ncbi:MAG: TRAP transporter small permease [Proteobacteria bacterium]|nr:TRAP transporter small permease [Pseudomonadota bacterium]
MRRFWTAFDKALDIMAALAGVMLVFICAAVCYTIGMRFIFRQTTIWITQTTEYALLWIVFLATTWLLREGGHVITEIVYVHLNKKTQQCLDCIMFIIGGLACIIMVYFSILYMYECIANSVTDVRAVTVPKWSVFCIIPIGSILLTIQFFRMAWQKFSSIREGG